MLALVFLGCNGDFLPKPKGYPRIDLPKKDFIRFDNLCPFSFEYPSYSFIFPHKGRNTMPYWLNIDFPIFKGTIHISYLPIANETSLKKFSEDARSLADKHTIKAQSIDERVFHSENQNVYGKIYNIKGKNTASSMQFYLTDSVTHFLRGALYFNVAPKNDSLLPVTNFIREDIEHLINTFQWNDKQ